MDTIADKLCISEDKYSYETFSKYANTSTASVVTVLCHILKGKYLQNVVLCSFGIGLSWAICLLNLSQAYNGGISFYLPSKNSMSKTEQAVYWINYFKGE